MRDALLDTQPLSFIEEELKQTAANAARLTAKIDAVGGDVAQLTGDPEFMEGVRNVTIGLGELFAEIYPAQIGQ